MPRYKYLYFLFHVHVYICTPRVRGDVEYRHPFTCHDGLFWQIRLLHVKRRVHVIWRLYGAATGAWPPEFGLADL